jgi:autotransporter-associated beta strand protein
LASSENLLITTGGSSYTMTLTGGIFSGTNSANVTGNGTTTLTVTSAGIAAYISGIAITDPSAESATLVYFGGLSSNAYANSFNVTLTLATDVVIFGGNTYFASGSLYAYAGLVYLSSDANVSTGGGNLTLTASGGVGIGTFATISSATGALTLGADLTPAGQGDDGVGTLEILQNASVYGSTITLRGADIDLSALANVANVGNSSTNSVTIQSSVKSRPMQIGGSNNSAVNGINMISSKLARIVTSNTGTITIGDSSQTGNITFTNATPATTAGASLVVVQSSSGAGQIVLDDGAGMGTALNGNMGAVAITAGTGGIVEAATDTAGTPDISGSATSLTSAGAVGTGAKPIQFASTILSVNTSANNSNQFLATTGAVQLFAASALNAGTGTLTLAKGAFIVQPAAAGNAIADSSPVVLTSPAILNLNNNNETIASLSDGGVTGGMVNLSGGTLTTGSASNTTFSGVIFSGMATSNTGIPGGLGSVTKVGSGTFTLSGANTYGGTTLVSAGTLLVNGTNSGTGPCT